ncbi:MAG: gamma-glutamyltransferase [Bdellovibrionota bacterium]|nr:gamma-glutamyltransferase [Bdellovibrionota bacterium]
MKLVYRLSLLVALISCSAKNFQQAELLPNKSRSQYEARGNQYMISTQGEATTKAAKFVFDKGGNIYDAAVAASFAISVERPHSTGLGGGGFMVIHHAKDAMNEAFDFREMAPKAAHSKMFLDKSGKQVTERSLTGGLASGTPGLVAGVLEVHKKYGKLDLATVMEPAIELAEKGFPVYPALAEAIKAKADKLCQFRASKKIFLKKNCEGLNAGELLVQTDLANTLKTIAKKKRDGFYKGEVAKKIVASQKRNGGLMTLSDLKNYLVKKRTPVEGTYKGYKIVSMPPPSSGGTHVIQILNILEGFDIKALGAQSAEAIHLTSSAMQIAFADRAEYMGDSDFKKVPVSTLVSKEYAKKLRERITLDKALSSKDFPIPFKELMPESDHTTHFTIMDGQGNIVTSTQTINGWFGSSVVAEGTGIVMNNEMDDFASHVGGVNLFGAVGGKNNLVEPRKRPLSSMSPTIVFDKEGKPFMALGTPSGTRILTCVMQTVLNVLEHDMPLWEAVAATRYHHQWSPEEIRIGPPYFSTEVEEKLKAMGHKINHKSLGCKIQAIQKQKDGTLLGVSDPREEGMSFGI